MGEELTRSLRVLAERGEQRGATSVLEDARASAASAEAVGRPSWRRGFVVAMATATAVLALVAVVMLVASPFGGVELSPATTPSVVTEPPDVVPGPDIRQWVRHPAEEVPSALSTRIGELEFEWLLLEGGTYHGLHGLAWTPHGLVALDDRLFWSTDYYTWHSIDTPVRVNAVTVVDGDVVVHGFGGTVRYAWEEDGWVQVGNLEVNDVEKLVFGQQGAVAIAEGSVWYSKDGVHFEEAAQGPSFDPPLGSSEVSCRNTFGPLPDPVVLATGVGYVALTPAAQSWPDQLPICEPVLWTSVDGSRWNLAAEESPFGESSAVYAVAERDRRYVAVGASGTASAVAWFSDDGLAWEPTEFDLEFIDAIAGGDLGWVLTGANAFDEQLIFFSADGRTWDGPYERPEALNTGYLPPHFVVGEDVIFGVGGTGSDALLARLQD